MKKLTQIMFGLCLMLAFGFANTASAQTPLSAAQVTQLKASNQGFILGKGTMSAADKRELTRLLRGVNPNDYFVRFSDGTTMGRKNFGLSEVRAVSRVRRPGAAQGMTFIVESPDYLYIYTNDFQAFQSRVGQAKALKINELMSKYQ